MQHFHTLAAYCKGINIAPPKWDDVDIRSFEDNMGTVHHRMSQFKHEFYAIAIKIDGGGYTATGNYTTKDLQATVFFNSPYQIISWDIAPDWKGYYIIFSEDFYRRTLSRKRLTEDFSFLLIDHTIPMSVSAEEAELYHKLFTDIHFEFQFDAHNSKDIIAHYLKILLHKVDRLYKRNQNNVIVSKNQRTQDLEVIGRFKTLLEISFRPGKEYDENHPHKVQYYADALNLHPNHFNAIVKRITEQSASEHIYKHILSLATSQLKNTSLTIKEIAFNLYYEYPNHFGNFFKSHMNMTPSQYRKSFR
ncbi:MAG: helix-turn-helix domain-containing protein [Saonia sp.]